MVKVIMKQIATHYKHFALELTATPKIMEIIPQKQNTVQKFMYSYNNFFIVYLIWTNKEINLNEQKRKKNAAITNEFVQVTKVMYLGNEFPLETLFMFTQQKCGHWKPTKLTLNLSSCVYVTLKHP